MEKSNVPSFASFCSQATGVRIVLTCIAASLGTIWPPGRRFPQKNCPVHLPGSETVDRLRSADQLHSPSGGVSARRSKGWSSRNSSRKKDTQCKEGLHARKSSRSLQSGHHRNLSVK